MRDHEGGGRGDEEGPRLPVVRESEPQEEDRPYEELADRGGDRVRGLERVGHRDRDERRREEARTILMEDADRQEEHDHGNQRGEGGDDEVDGPAELEAAERRARDEEEHPWEVRVRDPPSRVWKDDVARRDQAPGDPEVLPDIAPEIHEAGQGRDPQHEGEGDDGEEGGRGRLPHPAGDGWVVEKLVVDGRRRATRGLPRRPRRSPSPSRDSPASSRMRTSGAPPRRGRTPSPAYRSRPPSGSASRGPPRSWRSGSSGTRRT